MEPELNLPSRILQDVAAVVGEDRFKYSSQNEKFGFLLILE